MGCIIDEVSHPCWNFIQPGAKKIVAEVRLAACLTAQSGVGSLATAGCRDLSDNAGLNGSIPTELGQLSLLRVMCVTHP